jgi:hypothetical protein
MNSILKSYIMIFHFISVVILIPLSVHAQTPLPCNQTVSDSISVVGETDEYTFDAAAGDVQALLFLIGRRAVERNKVITS